MEQAPLRFLAVALVALAPLACSTGSDVIGCRVNGDCVSGVCRADLTCEPATGDAGDVDAGRDAGTATDAGASDGGSTADGGTTDGGTSATCAPDKDGRIEASEVPLRAGLFATFRIAENLDAVDTAGVGFGANVTWDFARAFDGDRGVRAELEKVQGQWFAGSFPTATYAAQLLASGDLLGVFRVTESELQLLGVVSRNPGVGSTNLSNTPPVPVLKFPLELNKTWTVTTSVSGLAAGFLTSYQETYTSKVDKGGTVRTPFASFAALRVNTQLDRLSGVFAQRSRTHLFVTECFGTIATIRSGELGASDSPEFDHADELRRLSP